MGSMSKKRYILNGVVVATVLLSGCMSSKIQERVDEAEKTTEEKDNPVIEDMTDVPPEEIELSDEQKEIIENMETEDVYEAIENNKMEERTELPKFQPPVRDAYKDEKEFSQFVSALFYEYMTKKIESDVFYDKISPHFHADFKALLPESENYQRQTFKILQDELNKALTQPIVDYKITNVDIDPRTKEATFYRVYILKNGEQLYYMTYMKPDESGRWLLTNDKLAPPYEEAKAKTKFEENKD